MLRSMLFTVGAIVSVSPGFCESVWVSHLLGAELQETYSAESETVAMLSFGTELRVMDEYWEPASYDLWYLVEDMDASGWIPAGYVDGSPPGGYEDAPLVVAATAVYKLILSGKEEGVRIASPLTVEYNSSDRINGEGQGSTRVDSLQDLLEGICIPVIYDGRGWNREEPAAQPYSGMVEVDIPHSLRDAQANSCQQFGAPRFNLHSDSLSCMISTGSHWYVHLFFSGEPHELLELVGIRYTTIDPG